jgi:hypothetical protein
MVDPADLSDISNRASLISSVGELPGRDNLAPCGCNESAAAHGSHRHECLIHQTVARLDKHLPVDSDQHSSAIAELATSSTVWADTDVLPDGAVLYLTQSPPPGLPFGLWQRQGKQLAPITADTYAHEVKRCTTNKCGMCLACWRAREYIEERVDISRTTTEKLQATINTLADAAPWVEAMAAWDVGDAYDLRERDDAQYDLDAAARHLRSLRRIVAAHLTTVEKLEEAARTGHIIRDCQDG